jgi:hypothetical protein
MRELSRQWMLKPQDLALAFKLLVLAEARPSFQELGASLRLSQFEAHAAFNRLKQARLLSSVDEKPIAQLFADFVCHGAIYVSPAVRGEQTIGFVTAHAMSPLSLHVLFADDSPPVWPHPKGDTRGISLLPLYPKLPEAAKTDKNLYELLALFDALRIGQARERALANQLLRDAIMKFGAQSDAKP